MALVRSIFSSASRQSSRSLLRSQPINAPVSSRPLACLVNNNSSNSTNFTTNSGKFTALSGQPAGILRRDTYLLNATGVRRISTEGDEQLSKFLAEELEYEMENLEAIPKVGDFNVRRKGTNVELTRSYNRETVSVKFDINENNNIDEKPEGEDEDGPGEIVSYPHFTVSIEKSSGQRLEFDCIYEFDNEGDEEGVQDMGDSQGFDIFKFEHVAVLAEGESRKGGGGVYESETTNMDGNLYSMLLTLLMERGINGQFVKELLKFSTVIECRHHVKFLEDLKKFVDTK